MVSHLFFYQLVLIALVWLCVMLQWAWPSDPAAAGPTTREPTPPLPKRSRTPTPFAGLTTKPHCDACEHRGDSRPQPPSAPPPRLVPTRGRRRQVDTSTHFCPNPDCRYLGWVGWGHLRAHGHPNGGPWRQLLCVVCRRSFLETLGTLFHGTRVSVELIVRVIACLAEGLGIRGTARVFEVDPNTVLQWLVETAEQLRAFSQHFLHDVRGRPVQMDELFALLSAVKAGEVSEADAIERLERAPQWVWVAMDPESKLLLELDVGDRTLAMAQRVVHQVAQRPGAEATLDAAAAVTVGAGDQDRAPAAPGTSEPPCGVRDARGGAAGISDLRLADQHRLHGARQPEHPPACRRG